MGGAELALEFVEQKALEVHHVVFDVLEEELRDEKVDFTRKISKIFHV